MSDDRTEEQKAADKAVHEALEMHMRAYSVTLPDTPTVLVDWIVAYAGKLWNEEGDQLTRYGTHLGPDTAAYAGMGLLNCMGLYLDGNYMSNEPDDED